ncbi:MAG: thiamine phosphate synthase [Candidatus Omnitrophica bacterium]|nr:thiamine phosphate synthase [Candidatus Omnitrophota bacterium]
MALMTSRRKSLEDCKLYLILDRSVNSYKELFEIAEAAVGSGVDILQLRDKSGEAKFILEGAKHIAAICRDKAYFILNDRIDIAYAAGADGVHLGQDDLPIDAARKILPGNSIIGLSCQTLQQAKEAQSKGADYIGFGSVFKTLTKPQRDPMDLGLLRSVYKEINIPVFAIGGIDLSNVGLLTEIGVKRVAVCRAVGLADDIPAVVRDFSEALDK